MEEKETVNESSERLPNLLSNMIDWAFISPFFKILLKKSETEKLQGNVSIKIELEEEEEKKGLLAHPMGLLDAREQMRLEWVSNLSSKPARHREGPLWRGEPLPVSLLSQALENFK